MVSSLEMQGDLKGSIMVSSVGDAGLIRVVSSCIFFWRLAGGAAMAPDTAVFCR